MSALPGPAAAVLERVNGPQMLFAYLETLYSPSGEEVSHCWENVYAQEANQAGRVSLGLIWENI